MTERFSGLLLPLVRASLSDFGPIVSRFAEDLKHEAKRASPRDNCERPGPFEARSDNVPIVWQFPFDQNASRRAILGKATRERAPQEARTFGKGAVLVPRSSSRPDLTILRSDITAPRPRVRNPRKRGRRTAAHDVIGPPTSNAVGLVQAGGND
jgi:hypothetical protein